MSDLPPADKNVLGVRQIVSLALFLVGFALILLGLGGIISMAVGGGVLGLFLGTALGAALLWVWWRCRD